MKFKMKSIAVAAVVLAASSQSGFSADADMTPDFNWTGFYGGVYGSYGLASTTSALDDLTPKGVFGGIDIGAQYQFESIVVGLEGNFSLSDLDHDKGSGVTFSTQDVDHIGSVKAKLGIPLNDKMMAFATAGWSWADTEFGVAGLPQQQKKVSGPSLGAGMHYAFTDMLIGRAEYVHYFYGKTDYNLGGTPVTANNSANEFRIGIDILF